MPPKTKSGLIRVLPVLLGLSGALPTVATEYQAADYLPLAVGNSWTYEHDHADRDADYSQWSTYTAQHPETPQFTIEVLRTEELDGQTYYVISDMPSFWPPPPPHFIAGKTLRWEGGMGSVKEGKTTFGRSARKIPNGDRSQLQSSGHTGNICTIVGSRHSG